MKSSGSQFEKTFSRDVTFLLASSAFYNFPENFLNYSQDSIADNPVLKQVVGGVVEFWLNKPLFDQLNKKLAGIIISDKNLFSTITFDYERISNRIRNLLNKDNPQPVDALEMCELFLDLRLSNHVMFFSSMENGWPDEVVDWGKSQREKDDLWSLADSFIRKCFSNIDLSLAQIKTLSLIELKDLVSFGGIKNALRQVFVEDCRGVIYDESLDELSIRFGFTLAGVNISENKVSGQIAFPGFVKGVVKIVRVKEDMDKVNNGDVLIASMTTPDFLSAMKKSSAFVTDEGGLLCHAAIVSREFKKPCIIGTKIATKVFKDGDMVEVDANTGIIRKIIR